MANGEQFVMHVPCYPVNLCFVKCSATMCVNRLMVVGGDDFHTLRVVEWHRNNAPVVAESRGHGNDVLAVRFNTCIVDQGSISAYQQMHPHA
jgi:hypothetical protein